MQFLVVAYDGKDEDAKARRAAARPSHLAGAQELKEAGNIIVGAAILDENEEMIGSTLCVEFESRADLDEWLANDPYVTEGVWKDIAVQPIRLAVSP
ncbi:MAG: YciI family protein [Pseudohongiellaceae bacterium]